MTASTVAGTLSRVITSCFGTSIVMTRRSILTMRSTIGMSRISPGPFAPSSLPNRKITPRSYSRRMRIICGSTTVPNANKATIHGIRPNDFPTASMICTPLAGFGFHFQRQSLHLDNLNALALLHGHIADSLPVFSFDKHFAAPPINGCQRRHHLTAHCLGTDLDGHPLRPQAGAYHKNEK